MTPAQNLKRVLGEFHTMRKNAIGAGCAALVRDAVKESPTPPIDTGNLRASWAISVDGTTVATGAHAGGVTSDVTHGGSVSFNAPYAHYQHEGISRFTGAPLQPGQKSLRAGDTGPKFLESKVFRNKGKYLQAMVNTIKRNMTQALSGVHRESP